MTNSARRSKYIGVFKNNHNWQAFITMNKKKIYIGSYSLEEGAAKAFDFYSILLNKEKATTNFDYTKQDLFEILQEYNTNGNKYISEWEI